MAITSAFQADDAGSIPAARSSFQSKAHSCEWAFCFFLVRVFYISFSGHVTRASYFLCLPGCEGMKSVAQK